jgi:hypothetical protein
MVCTRRNAPPRLLRRRLDQLDVRPEGQGRRDHQRNLRIPHDGAERRGRRHPSETQNASIEDYGQLAPADDSLIKARYASTILRVAQTSDREVAARLVGSIAGDLPLQNELPEVADIHLRAIASFVQLATSLRDKTNPKQQPPWKTALDAGGGLASRGRDAQAVNHL